MGRIQDIGLKIKGLGADLVHEWGLVLIVFLVALASFGLGRLSALEDARPPISITQAPTAANQQAIAPGGLLVAARSGSVYYYPWCTGASKILPQNQRWFQSEEAARKAGYAPAKNCKGLGTVSSE